MFEVETGSDLVCTKIVCEIVSKGENLILHTVVVREELCTEADIRLECL